MPDVHADPQDALQRARQARDQGRITEARQLFETLLHGPLEDALRAEAHTGLASVLHISGRTREAMTHLNTALKLREQHGDTPGTASIHLNLAVLWGDVGDHGRAIRHFEQARVLIEATRDAVRLRILHINLGRALIEHGELERGERVTREGLALVDDATPARHRALLTLNLAEALRRQERHEEALRLYGDVMRLTAAARLPDLELRALHGRALLEVARSRHLDAREFLFEALRLAQRTGDLDAELLVLSGLAEVSLATAQFDVACNDAELVLNRAQEGGRLPYVVLGHTLMSRALDMLGHAAAGEHARLAREVQATLDAQLRSGDAPGGPSAP